MLNSISYCGRFFTPEEISRIQAIIAEDPARNRNAISRLVCKEFCWYKLDGKLKEMSCRVALLRMHRAGLIVLPAPQKRNSNGKLIIKMTPATDPSASITISAGTMHDLHVELVDTKNTSRLWNEYIARYHYLGYTPLPGAQLRFFVRNGNDLLALLGFGAAAWSVAPRDLFIGWSPVQRQRNLHFVVNNARFLILPWVNSKNLASKILSMVSKLLPLEWEKRYGYKPVLLETFVECQRFKGTCYRAANWVHVGITQGRGKLDRKNEYAKPIKDILLYPLDRHFRKMLLSDSKLAKSASFLVLESQV